MRLKVKMMKLLERVVALTLIWAILMNGCTSGRAVPADSGGGAFDTQTDYGKGPIRVLLEDGTVVEIMNPHAERDTLFGLGKSGDSGGQRPKYEIWNAPVAIPLEDVASIEREEEESGSGTSVLPFVGLVVLGVVIVAGIVAYSEASKLYE